MAGFIRRDGRWLVHWEQVNEPGARRDAAFARARDRLAGRMAWPGEALARRKMVFVDGLCPDGREVIEAVALALKGVEPDR